MYLKKLLINDQDEVRGRRGRIGKAAWQLEDAMANRLAPAYPDYPLSVLARALHFETSIAENLGTRAMQCLVLLSIFETPTWCDTTSSSFDFSMTSEQRCNIEGTPNADNLFLSSVPYVPPGIGVIVEMVCLIIVSYQYWLKWKLQATFFDNLDIPEGYRDKRGFRTSEVEEYHSKTMAKCGLLMVFVGLVDCVAFLRWRSRYRVTFLTRTGILATTPCFKEIMECVIAVIPDFRSGLTFFLGAIGFFTWIAVTIFDDIPNTTMNVYGERVNEGLNSMSATLNTMFIAGATDEFVDCFLKSYSFYRVSGILWLVFLITVQVLLKSLMLDTLVAAYMKHSEELEEDMLMDQVKGIDKAFQSLCEATDMTMQVRHSGGQDKLERVVDECYFLDFVTDFSSSPNTNPVDQHTAELMFKAIDKDGSHSVDQGEFSVLCGILNYDIWVTEVDSSVADMFPSIWNCFLFRWLRKWVTDGSEVKEVLSTFDAFMNSVLITNLVLVLLETKQNMETGDEAPWLEQMELIFSFIYVMECGVKLCIYSFEEYWSERSNQFDFFTTWLLLASSICDELSTEDKSFASLKRYVNILRLLRLLRVLKQLKRLKRVQFMVKTCIRLVAASKAMVTSLLIVLFFFTSLSVQLWGGLLYKNNPALKGTEYDEAHYHVLNYNDFLSAFGAWVISLMCEYVPKFTDAVVAASGRTAGAYVVFLSFYFFTVSVMFELVKAFTIEVFIGLNNQDKKEQEQLAREQAAKTEKRADGCFARLFGSKKIQDQEEKEEARSERNVHALKLALNRVSDTVEKTGKRLHFRAIGDEAGVNRLVQNFDKLINESVEHSDSEFRQSGQELEAEHEMTDVALSEHE